MNYWKALGGALGGLVAAAVTQYGPQAGITLDGDITLLVTTLLAALGAYIAPKNVEKTDA